MRIQQCKTVDNIDNDSSSSSDDDDDNGGGSSSSSGNDNSTNTNRNDDDYGDDSDINNDNDDGHASISYSNTSPTVSILRFVSSYCIPRVPDQNGISPLYNMLKIYHSRPEHSIYKCIT